jgi:hypothetical protein
MSDYGVNRELTLPLATDRFAERLTINETLVDVAVIERGEA